MKKGMCVTLEDNISYVLVDSVIYKDEKFFVGAATETDDVKYFKAVIIDGDDALEEIDENSYPEVIEALSNHVLSTFTEIQ